MRHYSQHIQECFDKVRAGHSKLNDKALNMEGMSDSRFRNFLNLLLEMPNAKYLEVGVWRGATLYSALYKNNLEYAYAVDNFSEFCCDGSGKNRKRILDFKIFIDDFFKGGRKRVQQI